MLILTLLSVSCRLLRKIEIAEKLRVLFQQGNQVHNDLEDCGIFTEVSLRFVAESLSW